MRTAPWVKIRSVVERLRETDRVRDYRLARALEATAVRMVPAA